MAQEPTPVEPVAPVVPPVEPVAPVTPVVAEPAAEPTVPAEAWADSGDSLIDTLAKGYIAKGGSVAQFNALMEDVGNTGKLTEGAKVELKRAFGDMAEAFIPSIEAKAQASLEHVTRERKAVYDAVGGESKFTEMQAWAKDNLDPDTRGFLSAALNKGGKSAQLAVQQLKQFMIEGGATVEGTTHKVEGAPAETGEALTLAVYLQERGKLERAGDRAGVAALQARANTAIKNAAAKGVKWR